MSGWQTARTHIQFKIGHNEYWAEFVAIKGGSKTILGTQFLRKALPFRAGNNNHKGNNTPITTNTPQDDHHTDEQTDDDWTKTNN